MEPKAEGKRRPRTTVAVGILVVEAGLAVVGVLVHYSFTAMYGDATDLAVGGWSSRLSSGIGGVGLVGVVALVAVSVARQRWARLVAVTIPVLMFGAMLVVTPAALRDKLASQYRDTPQCVSTFEPGPGPGADAELESQRAFESMQHVGHFGGGGGSGVVGCDRSFELIEDVDVLQHYRAALPAAGWRVVEDDTRHLRAERDAMAFEVILCGRGGVVWAGNADLRGGARCRPVY